MSLTDDQIAKLKDEQFRGAQAQAVWDNHVFQECISRVRQKYIDAWLHAPLADKEGQHYIRVLLAAHDSIISEMEQVMRTGQMATFSLKTNPFRARPRKAKESDDV